MWRQTLKHSGGTHTASPQRHSGGRHSVLASQRLRSVKTNPQMHHNDSSAAKRHTQHQRTLPTTLQLQHSATALRNRHHEYHSNTSAAQRFSEGHSGTTQRHRRITVSAAPLALHNHSIARHLHSTKTSQRGDVTITEKKKNRERDTEPHQSHFPLVVPLISRFFGRIVPLVFRKCCQVFQSVPSVLPSQKKRGNRLLLTFNRHVK